MEVQSPPIVISCDSLADFVEEIGTVEQRTQSLEVGIDWSVGANSIFDGEGSDTSVQQQTRATVLEGSITSGPFSGAATTRINLYPVGNLTCATNGAFSTAVGVSTLLLTSP